jgi:hypothetical protein
MHPLLRHTHGVNDYLPAAAVLRFDPGWREAADDEIQNSITVVAVVPTLADADSEVARLSALAGGDVRYLRAYTRWYPEGRVTQ